MSDRNAMLKLALKKKILYVLAAFAPQCGLINMNTEEFYDTLLSVGLNIDSDQIF